MNDDDRGRDIMEAEMPQYDLLDSRNGQIKEIDAHDLRCRWMTPGGRVQQRIVFLSPGRGEVVTFAATAEDDNFDGHRDDFNALLANLEVSEVKAGAK